MKARTLSWLSGLWLLLAALAGIGIMEGYTRSAGLSSTIDDSFTWLEERTGARALSWVQVQNKRTRDRFTGGPRYPQYYDDALTLALSEDRLPGSDTVAWVHEGWLYEVYTEQLQSRGVLRRIQLEALRLSAPSWQVLLDVDDLARREGQRYDLRSLPSCFGARCLIPLSLVGATGGVKTWREFDVERASFITDGFALNSPQMPIWKDANTLIVASKSIVPDERRGSAEVMSLKQWSRGKPLHEATPMFQSSDMGLALMPIASESSDRQFYILGTSPNRKGDRHWKLNPNGHVEEMHFPPTARILAFHRNQWVLRLREDWNARGKNWTAGSLVSIGDTDITQPSPNIDLLMRPGPRETIDSAASTPDGVLIVSHANVRGRLMRFTFERNRWIRSDISLPDFGTVRFAMGSAYRGPTVVKYESFLKPATIYAVDVAAAYATPLKTKPPQFDASQHLTEQFEAVSKDGTRVPYFVVRPKAIAYDGKAPTLLRAYGGNGIPQYPSYDSFRGRLWLEQGGVYVLANIRGGGEFGPAWHYAAVKTRRHRSIEDFIAVAHDLMHRKITSPKYLGIDGHSNGAGLMGVMFNNHPELFNAMVAENGVMDWIRNDLQNASLLVKEERGSPEIPEEREFLDQVSPYQNLRPRTGVPTSFIVTSTTDDNVHPAMSRKFAAKMEALGLPYYFYEAPEGGHSQYVTPEQRALYHALKYTYLSERLMDQSKDR